MQRLAMRQTGAHRLAAICSKRVSRVIVVCTEFNGTLSSPRALELWCYGVTAGPSQLTRYKQKQTHIDHSCAISNNRAINGHAFGCDAEFASAIAQEWMHVREEDTPSHGEQWDCIS